jgi:hypothetical protein
VEILVSREKLVELRSQTAKHALAFSLVLWHSESNSLILELYGCRVQFSRITLPSTQRTGGGWTQMGRIGDVLYERLRHHFTTESVKYQTAVREGLIEPLLPLDLLPTPISGKSKKPKEE